jgi:preprotein translocase subunit YajC
VLDPIPVADKIAVALKGTPMLLTMLIINLAVLGMVTYLTVQAAALRMQERSELVKALQDCVARCKGQ